MTTKGKPVCISCGFRVRGDKVNHVAGSHHGKGRVPSRSTVKSKTNVGDPNHNKGGK